MMDQDMEQDRLHQLELHQLDRDVELLDTQDASAVVRRIKDRYQHLSQLRHTESPQWQWPLWQLVQDIERQAAVYSNIIEELKSGKDAGEVKERYETTLGLVPEDTLSNPLAQRALNKAFKMARHYTTVIVVFIKDFGQEMLDQELGIGAEHTGTLQVQIGLPPSVILGTEYTKVGLGVSQPAL